MSNNNTFLRIIFEIKKHMTPELFFRLGIFKECTQVQGTPRDEQEGLTDAERDINESFATRLLHSSKASNDSHSWKYIPPMKENLSARDTEAKTRQIILGLAFIIIILDLQMFKEF